jgi:hypothetical protein
MDALTISRRLGHGSPTVTLSVYGHMIAGSDSRAAEIMEATFAKVRQQWYFRAVGLRWQSDGKIGRDPSEVPILPG